MSARDEFFVGFFPVPPGLRAFLLAAGALLILVFGAVGWLAATAQRAPEAGGFRFDLGEQEVTGVLQLSPYPLLYVTEGNERLPAGRTMMLSGGGKFSPPQAEGMDGTLVRAKGVILKRGDLDMLQIGWGPEALTPLEGAAAIPAEVPLGRWRLTGEICDGKCAAGAMRPGRGLAHKACANLCVIGGVPAVFVSAAPVEGSEFLLLAGPDGGPLPEAALAHMAAIVTAEGEISRRGDLLVFRIDPASLAPI